MPKRERMIIYETKNIHINTDADNDNKLSSGIGGRVHF